MEVYIWGKAEAYRNYQMAVMEAGGRVRFGGSTVGCDALLLPGGGDLEPWRYGQRNSASQGLEPERDAVELELLEQFTAQNKPVLGICRGIQTINVFFGGTLIQDLPGHSAVNGADRYHDVTTAPSLLRELYGEAMIVNSAHHQAIDCVGRGLRVLQKAPDGTIEAICHEALPVWALQWHPERMPETIRRVMFRAFLRGWSELPKKFS